MTRLLRACPRRSRSTGAARSRTRSWGRTTSYTYNGNGQLLTATNSAGTITVVYDRLGRQTSVDPDDGSTATTWTYTSFTSQTRVDVTGTTTATLDTFGRETSLTTPMIANPFTFTYRADGQRATQGDPSGTTTTFTYDRLGRMTDKDVTDSNCTGSVCATLDWTYNRSGQRLTEAQDTMGTPGTDGTSTFTHDKVGRITGFDSPLGGTSTDQAYGWQRVPNRDSLTIGTGTPSTLTYDAADRMTTSGYSHDADGRMTGQPGQTLVWDSLGRLKEVRNSSTNALISAHTYDALDRLRTVARASTIRFRYVGTSTGVAEVVDDGTNASQLKVGNGWHGERLATWTGTNSDPRYLGTNGHGDVTWSADGSGAVVNTMRYDPWGNVAAASGSSLPDWRFQGSWNDTSTGLSWVVTRWYAAGLGRFVSEDSLLGEPRNPLSRHLYGYAEGDPVRNWDPEGRQGYDTLRQLRQEADWVRDTFGFDAWANFLFYSVLADAYSKRAFGDQPRSVNGGKTDACRHCVWSGWLGLTIGFYESGVITVHHERFDVNTEEEKALRKMDLYNNAKGRLIAWGHRYEGRQTAVNATGRECIQAVTSKQLAMQYPNA